MIWDFSKCKWVHQERCSMRYEYQRTKTVSSNSSILCTLYFWCHQYIYGVPYFHCLQHKQICNFLIALIYRTIKNQRNLNLPSVYTYTWELNIMSRWNKLPTIWYTNNMTRGLFGIIVKLDNIFHIVIYQAIISKNCLLLTKYDLIL